MFRDQLQPELLQSQVEVGSKVCNNIKEVEFVTTILKYGSSGDRQLKRFQETNNLKDVVDMLIEETMIGC